MRLGGTRVSGRFSPQSIRALAHAITGGSYNSPEPPVGFYRQGYKIERFFAELGYPEEMDKSWSRVPFTIHKLEEIQDMPDGVERLCAVIDRLLEPRDYVEHPEFLRNTVDYLNRYFKYDGFEIRDDGTGRYRVYSRGVAPGVAQLEEVLDRLSLQRSLEDFNRAMRQIDHDPEAAIASANSTLESIAKAILDRTGTPYPTNQETPALVKEALKVLRLSPEGQADPELKRVVGGLVNAAAGIGVLRTRFSAAHGQTDSLPRLSAWHARLAVNAAASVGLFLVEVWADIHVADDDDFGNEEDDMD